jgi:Uma2 family endonuclease
MSPQPKSCLTPEEYLELERGTETKNEYFEGQVVAMRGASRPHSSIVTISSAL